MGELPSRTDGSALPEAWMYSFSHTQEKRHLWLALLLMFCEVRGGLGDWPLLVSSAALSYLLFTVENWAATHDWNALAARLTPKLPELPSITVQLPGRPSATTPSPTPPQLPGAAEAAVSSSQAVDMGRRAGTQGAAVPQVDSEALEALPDLEVLVRQEEEAAQQLWDRRMQLRRMPVKALREEARRAGISGRSKMNKRELVDALEAVGVHQGVA